MGKATEALAAAAGHALGTLLQPTPATEWLASVGPQLDRIKRQRAIEDAIVEFLPDAEEAQEILDALTASLRGRYEELAEDALHQAQKFRIALGEVSEPGEWEADEMTLAKEAALREAE